MAAHVRRSAGSLIDRLRSDPQRFDLLQAVRVAESAMPGAEPVGGGFDPRREGVRLRGSLSQAFPVADVAAWRDGRAGAPPELESAFFSLGGAFGPLPPPLSESAQQRSRRGDAGQRDFLDLFNHRLTSLFVRGKRTHRPTQQAGRPEDTAFADLVWALLGLGTPGLRHALRRGAAPRLSGQERSLLACVGLLNQRPISVHALERLLNHALAVPVRVVPYVGRWLRLDSEQTSQMGLGGRNLILGQDAVLGGRVWDQSAAIRIELGPLSLTRLRRMLPGAADHQALSALVGFALGGTVEVETKLIVPKQEVPQSRLSARSGEGARLGWTSWLTTIARPDVGEVVLNQGRPGE